MRDTLSRDQLRNRLQEGEFSKESSKQLNDMLVKIPLMDTFSTVDYIGFTSFEETDIDRVG